MKFLKRNKQFLLGALIIPLTLCFSGCIYLVVGGVGALGGYVVSPDTVEGLTENDQLAVWDSTIEILSIMGIILDQNESTGVLLAKVSGATVTITITSLNQSTSKVNVKSRKAFLPKIKVSQDVFVKIMTHLNE